MNIASVWLLGALSVTTTPMIGKSSMQAQAASIHSHPIKMEVREIDGIEWLIVEGDTSVPVELEYELTVASRAGRGGANRATQRGVARLKPNQPTVMVRLRVTPEWDAELIVRTLDKGEIYRENLSSSG
ncbi:hypothetical protein ACX0GZ_14020 [Sphingomonas aestuarii]